MIQPEDGYGGVDEVDFTKEKVAEDGRSAISPFDFVKSINGKKRLSEEDVQRFYDPFLTNRALSQFADSVAYAQCMNKYPNLPNEMQYDFLMSTVRKGNRYGKWAKNVEVDVDMIIDIYQVSKVKAIAIMDRLTPDNILDLEFYYRKGGKSK
ncbi:DNA polymerase clamp loader subunit [Paraglaciecola Antarctic GD virus 1]|nr:DNA polymerase clamp loader subunit [Paraglaciecola Antarctic GD virus 1]